MHLVETDLNEKIMASATYSTNLVQTILPSILILVEKKLC
jgi:hypothetical protein